MHDAKEDGNTFLAMTVAQSDASERGSASPTTGALLVYFLRLGTLGFGGPIALVAYMQRDLVDQRRWVAIDPATHRVYAPEQEEDGKAVARMIVYEAISH